MKKVGQRVQRGEFSTWEFKGKSRGNEYIVSVRSIVLVAL